MTSIFTSSACKITVITMLFDVLSIVIHMNWFRRLNFWKTSKIIWARATSLCDSSRNLKSNSVLNSFQLLKISWTVISTKTWWFELIQQSVIKKIQALTEKSTRNFESCILFVKRSYSMSHIQLEIRIALWFAVIQLLKVLTDEKYFVNIDRCS